MSNPIPDTNILTKTAKNSPYKRPLTLIVAIFFLLAALLPLILMITPTPSTPNGSQAPIAIANSTETMTVKEKVTSIASAIETACFSDGSESAKSFFATGTWIMLIALIASSLLIAVSLFLLYFSAPLYNSIKSILTISWLFPALVGVFVITVMHIYSIVLILKDFSKLNVNFLNDPKGKDTRTTELVFYLLRNILISAGFIHYLYRLSSFILSLSNAKKTCKNAKKLASAYTSVTLICCLFASTISLTWVFNFTTKALLAITVLLAANSFIMIGAMHELRKYLKLMLNAKKSIDATHPTDQPIEAHTEQQI